MPATPTLPTVPLGAAGALSFRQLSYLVTLAETLNFTRAAEACFVTQSTLSAGIRALEQTLEAPLFERNRRQVLPTPLGRALALRARSLLSEAADFVQAARAAAGPLQGRLTLGAIPTVAPFLLPPLLRRMRSALPELTVLLREETTAGLLRAVESGEVDFALIALPMALGHLRAHPLFREELWLIHAQDDPLARQAAPRASRLDLQRLLLLGEGHCLREHSLEACRAGRRGRRDPGASIEASSLATLVQMVEAGLGISLLPEMAVKAGYLDGSRVIARPLAAPAPSREIALVARATTPRTELLTRIQALCAGGQLIGTAASRRGRTQHAR